jgi:hypothetical protein
MDGLPLVLYLGQVDEFMVPRPRMDLFSILIDGRRDDQLAQITRVCLGNPGRRSNRSKVSVAGSPCFRTIWVTSMPALDKAQP